MTHQFNLRWGFLLFFGTFFLDQSTKLLAVHHLNYSSNWLNLSPVTNLGLLLNHFSQIEQGIRIVFVSTFGVYLNSFFLIFLYFLKNKNLAFLKYGLIVLMAAINGNVMDRIRLDGVIDFINLKIPLLRNIYFNVADIFFLFGALVVIVSLFVYVDEIWHPENKRKSYFIKPSYQFQAALTYVLGIILFSTTLIAFSYTYFKSYLPNREEIISSFLWGSIVITLFMILIMIFFSIIFTHKSVGPLLAFQSFLQKLEKGEETELKLREGDHFKELEEIAKKIKNLMTKKVQ